LAALVGALAGAPPAAASPLIGIGDQKPAMFGDARFVALGFTISRISVSWDALDVPGQAGELDAWLKAARADGVSPLISFDHSWRPGHHKDLPSAARFRHEFGRFHARYPWVTDFATWNEANYCGEITCHHPDIVAGYYLQMRSVCPHCKVLAAELLDLPGMVQWARQLEHYAHRKPAYWGLHDYIGANRFSTASTRQLLRFTKGQIWLTEIAGLVARHNRGHTPTHIGFPESAAHAAAVTGFIFHTLARLSPRISRIYFYEWNALPGPTPWDSALIGVNGLPRPAYYVLRDDIERERGLGKLGQPLATPTQPPSTGLASGSRVPTR
jgi:hypothetical protein